MPAGGGWRKQAVAGGRRRWRSAAGVDWWQLRIAGGARNMCVKDHFGKSGRKEEAHKASTTIPTIPIRGGTAAGDSTACKCNERRLPSAAGVEEARAARSACGDSKPTFERLKHIENQRNSRGNQQAYLGWTRKMCLTFDVVGLMLMLRLRREASSGDMVGS
ncbi:tetratricopeptide repeat protein [Striga asiatica]|uniref:Tetratricopeptide repeat protein n=1 Tax=Striga asiatica TaxID=4170 RepID=A0A5A7PJQ6_STRAF|nr:tetratricopeptide repeat protein [Striga asiatica]